MGPPPFPLLPPSFLLRVLFLLSSLAGRGAGTQKVESQSREGEGEGEGERTKGRESEPEGLREGEMRRELTSSFATAAATAGASSSAADALRGWWDDVNESPQWQDAAFFSLAAAYALVSAVALVRPPSFPSCTTRPLLASLRTGQGTAARGRGDTA